MVEGTILFLSLISQIAQQGVGRLSAVEGFMPEDNISDDDSDKYVTESATSSQVIIFFFGIEIDMNKL